jgi:hypothetical protein
MDASAASHVPGVNFGPATEVVMSKSLGASVGQGGLNKSADVMTVQFLLNCVPVSQGGPPKELAVDGLIGPKTVLAIRQFQTTQFGWCDGRVDPEQYGGMTIVALKTFDPVPDSPPIEPTPAPKFPSQPEWKGAVKGPLTGKSGAAAGAKTGAGGGAGGGGGAGSGGAASGGFAAGKSTGKSGGKFV